MSAYNVRMDVVLLASGMSEARGQALSTYLINGRLAVDAGSVGLNHPVRKQAKISDILLTHSHLDHIAGLPVLVDNVYGLAEDCVTVHATSAVLDCLREDVFNGRLFPDMIAMSERMPPFLDMREFPARTTRQIAGLTVTAIPVEHGVPTVGYIIEDSKATIAIITDTGPTEEIWKTLATKSNLAGVFLDCSFPDAELSLAKASRHLTPALFANEIKKLNESVPVYAIHLKPRYAVRVMRELRALGQRRIRVAKAGMVYRFGRMK